MTKESNQYIDISINTDNLKSSLMKLEKSIFDNSNAINEFKQNLNRINLIKEQVSESLVKIEATEGKFLLAFDNINNFKSNLKDLEDNKEIVKLEISNLSNSIDRKLKELEDKVKIVENHSIYYLTKEDVDIMITSKIEDFKAKYNINENNLTNIQKSSNNILRYKKQKKSQANLNIADSDNIVNANQIVENSIAEKIDDEKVDLEFDLNKNQSNKKAYSSNSNKEKEEGEDNNEVVEEDDESKFDDDYVIDLIQKQFEIMMKDFKDSVINNTKLMISDYTKKSDTTLDVLKNNQELLENKLENTNESNKLIELRLKEINYNMKIYENNKISKETEQTKNNSDIFFNNNKDNVSIRSENYKNNNISNSIRLLSDVNNDILIDKYNSDSGINLNTNFENNNFPDKTNEFKIKRVRGNEDNINDLSNNIANNENNKTKYSRKETGKTNNTNIRDWENLQNEQNKNKEQNFNILIRQLDYRINELRYDLTETDKRLEKINVSKVASVNDNQKNKGNSITKRPKNVTVTEDTYENNEINAVNNQFIEFNEIELYNRLYNKLMLDLYQKLKGNDKINLLLNNELNKSKKTSLDKGDDINKESSSNLISFGNKKLKGDVENIHNDVYDLIKNNRILEDSMNKLKEELLYFQDNIAKLIDSKESNIFKKVMDAVLNENKNSISDVNLQIKMRMDELYRYIDNNIQSQDSFRTEMKINVYSYDEIFNNLKNIINNNPSLGLNIGSISNANSSPNNDQSNNNNESKAKIYGISIKDFLRKLSIIIKSMYENLDKVTKKQESMLNIISNRLRLELKEENQNLSKLLKDDIKKIVENFSSELNSKAEVKLIEKLANQIEEKFDYEISKKLDKNEIKKNTNILNRKVSYIYNCCIST